MVNVMCRLRRSMSSENIRNVPVCRDNGYGGASHTVTESHEYRQGGFSGAAEPTIARRGSERIGEETRRRTQGVLWRERIALYHRILYITAHHSKAPGIQHI